MDKLNHFYEIIEKILTENEDISKQVIQLRDLVKDSLSSNQFQYLCVSEILNSIENYSLNNMQWDAPYFFYHEQLKFSVRVIYWPPFYDNNPHQHKTWSVTGVFHNQLNVFTYTLLDNPKRLKKEKSIIASAGDVGYLLPGCIHNVSNPSHEISASFHIFNNLDINNPEENAIWYPSPRKYNLSKGLIQRALDVCSNIVGKIDSENSFDIIKRIYALSPIQTKLGAIYAMHKYDRNYARQCFEELVENFY